MNAIKTSQLHWICYQTKKNSILQFYLSDTGNHCLSGPTLAGVTKEEENLLTQADIKWKYNEEGPVYINCDCSDKAEKVIITAPLYVQAFENHALYYIKTGIYCTGEWIHPKEYQRINETVEKIVSYKKIHFRGCYVDLF